MVFKRRNRRSPARIVVEAVYPRGGWGRAISYLVHRLRRLPDKPHRIARGVAVGILVSFSPFFGFHLLLAAALAWAVRANITAALLATLVGNPLTFPFIMELSVKIGGFMLGRAEVPHLPRIVSGFAQASFELARNGEALLAGGALHWHFLGRFWDQVFLPFLIGGIVPGSLSAALGYYLTLPLVLAYQRRRKRKFLARLENRRRREAEQISAARDGGPVVSEREQAGAPGESEGMRQ